MLIGLITYLRTDSTRVAEEADKTARAFIEEQYGSQYVSSGRARKRHRERSRMPMRPSVLPILP
ncbi:MAG: hypothetical protein ACLVF9_09910 [Enterocloster sp.]